MIIYVASQTKMEKSMNNYISLNRTTSGRWSLKPGR